MSIEKGTFAWSKASSPLNNIKVESTGPRNTCLCGCSSSSCSSYCSTASCFKGSKSNEKAAVSISATEEKLIHELTVMKALLADADEIIDSLSGAMQQSTSSNTLSNTFDRDGKSDNAAFFII